MRRILLATFTVLLCLVEPAVSPVRAQPPPASVRPAENLAQILEDIDWNPAHRGALLIVAPEKTARYIPPRLENGRPIFTPPVKFPQPGRNGYLLPALGDYFARRVVPCGTVSAFAPLMMTVLNTRLPKPDIYADLPPNERVDLFRSSLTPQQWQQLATPEGLGGADLSASQLGLFLSILPDPVQVYRVTGGGPNGENRSPLMELVGAQRGQVRLSMRQRIDWSYRYGENGASGTLSVGVENPVPPGQERLEMSSPPDRFYQQDGPVTMFGGTLMEEVRARLKPGDLPFDWNGLDPIVSLREVKTVGALMERIRTVTRVEFYADRRYASLPLYLRGESARAGDLLKALCQAVTGTYRKVGTAYVLTDDREGLGTRHALQQQWAWIGSALIADLRESIQNNLRKMPKSPLKWDSDDRNAPDDALKAKIAAFRARQKSLKPEERYKQENQNLVVPIAEMPPGAQAMIKRQVAYIEGEFRQNNPEPVRTDAVQIQTRPTMVMILPGGAALEMPFAGIGGYESGSDEEAAGEQPPAPPTTITLPAEISQRVLVIAPANADEARQGVTAARARGFTAVWVAVCPTEIALVEAAVAAGKEASIPVGALIHVLRSGSDTTLLPDFNLLGETETVAARHQSREPLATARAAGINEYYFESEDRITAARSQAEGNLTRAKRWGDWLCSDLPEARALLASKVTAIAKVPGLAGIALTDLAPPGYKSPGGMSNQTTILSGFGYTEAMRLDFLRKYGVDPIDLSPLEMGQLRAAVNHHYGEHQLPFFPDYGLTGKYASGSASYNGVSAYDMGAKDASEKWLEYRVGKARDFAQSLLRGLRASAPTVPRYIYRLGNENYPYDMRWATELNETEKALDFVMPPLISRQNGSPGSEGDEDTPAPRRQKPFKDQIKEKAKGAMLIALYQAGLPGAARVQIVAAVQRTLDLGAREWDGLIVDLSDMPLETAKTLLDSIKMPTGAGKP